MGPKLRFTIVNIFAKIPYFFARLFKFCQENCTLTPKMWKWLRWAALIAIAIFVFGYMLSISRFVSFLWLLFAMVMIVSLPLLYGGIYQLGMFLIRRIPKKLSWLIVAAGSMVVIFSMASFFGVILQLFFFLFPFLFLFGSLANISASKWNNLNLAKKSFNLFFLFVGLASLAIMIWFVAYPGPDTKDEQQDLQQAMNIPEALDLPNPSLPGNFSITNFTYGNGDDKHRDEYAENSTYISKTVDASSFLDSWDKLAGKLRAAYWGFSSDSLPLNARGWMPEGDGPFPLILMVHGNHLDRDYSDGGYDYFGELFASHGVMALSVDENFLNSAITNFFEGFSNENDARGWLLLKHLELLRQWNADTSSTFYHKLDLDNVILIGHSRGGEAVCIAAAFNSLTCYPDNAEEKFDFNFGIKGIASIAQVDGQYYPSGYATKLEDINFLSLQGSMDADLTSYSGLRQFNRIKYSDSTFLFKAGIYIPGANHSQFNTSWGKYDIGYPNSLFLNRKGIMEADDQQRIAQVYLNAFQKEVFGGRQEYLPFFRDFRRGREWLPDLAYVNQFQGSDVQILADYEEDIDVYSGINENVKIYFEELAKLNEAHVSLRKGKTHSKAVYIGWNNEEDSIPGSYGLRFCPPLSVIDDGAASLVFDVGALDQDPGERWGSGAGEPGSEGEGEPGSKGEERVESGEERVESGEERVEGGEDVEPVSFHICLVNTKGDSARVSLKDYYLLFPAEAPKIFKLDVLADPVGSEMTPQYVSIPFAEFANITLDSITSINFIFNEGDKGMVCIDNIGIQP